jgi:hypothetical protein
MKKFTEAFLMQKEIKHMFFAEVKSWIKIRGSG